MFEVTADQSQMVEAHLERCPHCDEGVKRIYKEMEKRGQVGGEKHPYVSKDQELVYKI
jgi:anti-sigma factor RsiW